MIAVVLLACGESVAPTPGTPTAPSAPDEAGWIAITVHEPSRFAELTATGKDGWVALHEHRYEDAAKAFSDEPIPRARAEWALAMYQRDLSRLSGLVNHRLFTTWKERTGLPQGSAAVSIAALAASCSVYSLDTWTLDPSANEFVKKLASEEPPYGLEEDHPIARRMRLHRRVEKENSSEPLDKHATEPIVIETGSSFDRRFYDPCLHETLARHWTSAAVQSLGGADWRAASAFGTAGLAGTLFAPWIDADVVADGVAHHGDPGLLGVASSVSPPGDDDLVAAREEVRALDSRLDGWQARLLEEGSDDGDALLNDLGLVARYRQEWLTARGRQALLANRPAMALTYLEMARDVTERGVGPRNGPALMAMLAEAQIRLGRTREALDALQMLVVARPEVTGIREHLGDLAVLQGLDRQGDSKEN